VGHPVYLLVGHPLRHRLFHDVVKRSQGGSDFDLDRLVALCRWCHDQTDAPYERGVWWCPPWAPASLRSRSLCGRGLPLSRPGFQRLPTWAKIQPFNADNGGSALWDVRFAHVGKPRRVIWGTAQMG